MGDATGSAASATTPHRAPRATFSVAKQRTMSSTTPTTVTVAKPPSVSVGEARVLRCRRMANSDKETLVIAVPVIVKN
jgi:hypothetical protein